MSISEGVKQIVNEAKHEEKNQKIYAKTDRKATGYAYSVKTTKTFSVKNILGCSKVSNAEAMGDNCIFKNPKPHLRFGTGQKVFIRSFFIILPNTGRWVLRF